MSQYYNAKRTKYLYQPGQKYKFRLSRSKLEQFLSCARCFYIDRRLGVGQPPGFPFNLNSAVDHLLKKEFDIHRTSKTAHPLMKQYGINAIPFSHLKMNEWRENFVGVSFYHQPTNLEIFGAVDDIWVNPAGELMVVDYKATSKDGEVNLDAEWQNGYKRQMEIYQWLLRQNGFEVNDTGYFVYCNGDRDKQAFDGKLEFDVKIIPYTGKENWVEKVVYASHACLQGDLPEYGRDCDFCDYRKAMAEVEGEAKATNETKTHKFYIKEPSIKVKSTKPNKVTKQNQSLF